MPGDAFHATPTLGAITIMGSGRVGPTITALLGLAAAVLGARAFLAARRSPAEAAAGVRRRPTIALVLGLSAVVLGGVFLAAADGGPGTGNGVVGSAGAIALGIVAITLDRSASWQRRAHHRGAG